MALGKTVYAALAASLILGGCSETEITRSEEVSPRTDSETAGAPPEQRRQIAVIEDALRQQFGPAQFEIARSDITATGPDRYSVELELRDRLLGRTNLGSCRITMSGIQIENGPCQDRDPATARVVRNQINFALRGSTDDQIRDEILAESRQALGTGGSQLTDGDFMRDGAGFLVTYQRRSAAGERAQAGCGGNVRRGQDGRQVVEMLCRSRP